MAQKILQVDNLFCERDDRILFNNLEFSLNAGEIVQIEGQNGSGKTTLLRILGRLYPHYQGDIQWQGKAVDENEDAFRHHLLFLGHQAGIKLALTAEENLRWFAALHHDINLDDIYPALTRVGLRGYENLSCHQMSAGQVRRVGLARLYLSQAQLWILDEPFTAIDKKGVSELETLLVQHAERGGSVILTTHHNLGFKQALRRINLDDIAGTK